MVSSGQSRATACAVAPHAEHLKRGCWGRTNANFNTLRLGPTSRSCGETTLPVTLRVFMLCKCTYFYVTPLGDAEIIPPPTAVVAPDDPSPEAVPLVPLLHRQRDVREYRGDPQPPVGLMGGWAEPRGLLVEFVDHRFGVVPRPHQVRHTSTNNKGSSSTRSRRHETIRAGVIIGVGCIERDEQQHPRPASHPRIPR